MPASAAKIGDFFEKCKFFGGSGRIGESGGIGGIGKIKKICVIQKSV